MAVLWWNLHKKLVAYKVWNCKFSQLKFSIISNEILQSKKKRSGVCAKGSIFSRVLHPYLTIRQKYPNRDKHNQIYELIIFGRVWRKVSSRDKEGWCLEVSHKDFDNFSFFKQRVVSIHKKGDEEVILETISQVGDGSATRIINTYQDTEIVSLLEGNIKNLPLVNTGGCTINSEDVVELWRDSITVVDNNKPLEDNTPFVGSPVTEGEIYDSQVWGDDGINSGKVVNRHLSGPKIPIASPYIVTNLTLLGYLLSLFTMEYVKYNMLPGMNWSLTEVVPHVS